MAIDQVELLARECWIYRKKWRVIVWLKPFCNNSLRLSVAQQAVSGLNQDQADKRSVTAKAYHWASRIMTVSLEMVVPGLLGYVLLDRNLGTKGLFTLLGFGLGMFLGIKHLLKMTKQDAAGGIPRN